MRTNKFIFTVAEILVDKAMELDHIGGVFGGSVKPTPFLCLILKMLQIQPTKDIVVEFIKNPDYKLVSIAMLNYVNALWRIVCSV